LTPPNLEAEAVASLEPRRPGPRGHVTPAFSAFPTVGTPPAPTDRGGPSAGHQSTTIPTPGEAPAWEAAPAAGRRSSWAAGVSWGGVGRHAEAGAVPAPGGLALAQLGGRLPPAPSPGGGKNGVDGALGQAVGRRSAAAVPAAAERAQPPAVGGGAGRSQPQGQ